MTTNDPRLMRGMQAQTKVREARLASGETLIGWKLGYGSPAGMQKLGISAPLVGFLTSGTVLDSGAVVAAKDWKPGVEPEIAIHMGRDLRAGADRDEVRAAIAALGPAIELADVTAPPEDVEGILADNIHNRHVIFGKADTSRAGCVLDGLVARITMDGVAWEPITDVQAQTGDLIDLVRGTADTLAAFGETLRAGEVIIMGSLIPRMDLTESTVFDYILDPVDALRVALAV